MDLFLKATALILVTAILSIFLKKWESNTAILLSIAACCIVGSAAVFYIRPILALLQELESMGQLQNGMLHILIKAVGITFVAEIAAMLCKDTGNDSLGKMLQFLGSSTVLYLSIPVIQSVLNVFTEIIGEL